jgi:hypothetical protein
MSSRAAWAEPTQYRPHLLHGEARIWLEKNCYVDVWIALLHTLGLEPRAMLGCAAALDFLGDQWTFLKPDHHDLRHLYGMQVQELTLWRPLAEHVREHLDAGRLISVEADAWWLPDTAATDYRQQHTKTTIVIVADDPALQQLTYFHNAGLYTLHGEDYRQTLANGGLPMPLYAEWIDASRRHSRTGSELRRLAREHLQQHLAWSPTDNPMRRFAARFNEDLATLQREPDRPLALARYHAWAFAGTRQLGSAMELLALHLQWLDDPACAGAADHALSISQACKSLILKGARAAATGRPWQGQELLDGMTADWASLMAACGHGHAGD